MDTDRTQPNTSDRRAEERSSDERYYSVEFTTPDLTSYYQFKLWNISQSGMCILVKENSEVLRHLKVGDTLKMNYRLNDSQKTHENLKTEIKHITRNADGRFKGHCLIGLSIMWRDSVTDHQE